MTLGGALLAVGTGALMGVGVGLGVSPAAWAVAVRAATPAASQAVASVRANADHIAHIFGQARHGFQNFGIGVEKGLTLMQEILAKGIAALNQTGGPSPGEVVHLNRDLTNTVRMVVIARWADGTWVVKTAYLQKLVEGVWREWSY
jgi:hypothetical protein